MDIIDFFQAPKSIMHKQYEALRAFYVDKKSAITIAKEFGYSVASVYSLTRDFKKRMHNEDMTSYFFNKALLGRKVSSNHDELSELIILLRKKNLSVPDIKAILDAKNKIISERHIYNVLHKEGFARLPRRSQLPPAKAGGLKIRLESRLNAKAYSFKIYYLYGITLFCNTCHTNCLLTHGCILFMLNSQPFFLECKFN